MKRYLLVLFFLAPWLLMGQNISVSEFYLDQNDQTANAHGTQVSDQNGEACALIRIQTTQKGFAFDVGSIGVTKVDENHVGEVWVYLPHGVRRITIRHQQLGTLSNYQFPVSIEKARTYVMKLTTGTVRTVVDQAITQQFVKFQVTPEDASIILDGQLLPITDGTASKLMEFGSYDYRVDRADYHPEVGRITINDPDNPVVKQVTLKPAYGWISVQSGAAIGAIVYIDNVNRGTVPYRSDNIGSGRHSIKVLKDKYKSFDTIVTVEDGQTVTVTPQLQADFARLTFIVDNNAEIWINGERKGAGVVTGEYASGLHRIEAKLPHHRGTSRDCRVTTTMNGDTIQLQTPEPILGKLIINSVPADALITIDDTEMGQTPKMFSKIMEGSHHIVLKKKGFYDFDTNVIVTETQPTQLEARLSKRVDAYEVEFSCNLTGTDIFVDGDKVGTAPCKCMLKPGKHSIKANGSIGYYNYDTIIYLRDDISHHIDLQMQRFDFRVRCNVPSASLYVDSALVGPAAEGAELTYGTHNILLKAPGYRSYDKNWDITDDKSVKIKLRLKPKTIILANFGADLPLLFYDRRFYPSYGITVGYMGAIGFYASVMSNFNFQKGVPDINTNATVVYNNYDIVLIDDNTPILSSHYATAGLILRLGKPVWLYFGGGFGVRDYMVRSVDNKLYLVWENCSLNSFLDGGIGFNVGHVSFSFGSLYSIENEVFYTFKAGLGVNF